MEKYLIWVVIAVIVFLLFRDLYQKYNRRLMEEERERIRQENAEALALQRAKRQVQLTKEQRPRKRAVSTPAPMPQAKRGSVTAAPSPSPSYYRPPAPTHSSDAGDVLMGMAVGAMIGHALSSSDDRPSSSSESCNRSDYEPISSGGGGDFGGGGASGSWDSGSSDSSSSDNY